MQVTSSEKVLGFGTYGPFRNFSGSMRTVELSIYADRTQRRQGVGTALLKELILAAQNADKKSLVGVIDAENQGSMRLHERMGFVRVGRASKFPQPLGHDPTVHPIQSGQTFPFSGAAQPVTGRVRAGQMIQMQQAA